MSRWRVGVVALAVMGCSAGSELSEAPPPDAELVGESREELRLSVLDMCSTSQKADLRAAERLARYITQDHIVKWITEPRGTAPHFIVDKFFDRDGVWDQRTTDFVRSRLGKIHDRIAEGDVVVRCRDLACSSIAHVWRRGQEKITFCDAYFELPPDEQASGWSHELSHELFMTDDPVLDSAGNLRTLEARTRSYRDVERYVDNGGDDSAMQYGAFVHVLVAEFFDAWYRSVGKGEITQRQLDQAILDVHHELNPLYRIRDEVDWCWDGDTTSTACLAPMTGRHRRVCEAAEWKTVESCQSECATGSRCCAREAGKCTSCVAQSRPCL